jgi:hypothetical protein
VQVASVCFFETWEINLTGKHKTAGEATVHSKSILLFCAEEAMKMLHEHRS